MNSYIHTFAHHPTVCFGFALVCAVVIIVIESSLLFPTRLQPTDSPLSLTAARLLLAIARLLLATARLLRPPDRLIDRLASYRWFLAVW